jgi:hypothetical protein
MKRFDNRRHPLVARNENAWEIIKPIKSNGHHRYLSGLVFFRREQPKHFIIESKKMTAADCHFSKVN